MARTAPAPPRSRPLLEDLEPRILFAADGPGALLGAAAGADLLRNVHEVGLCDDTPLQPAVQSFEIVFIDARVADVDTLLAGLRAEAGNGRHLEVVTIGAEEDAVTLIGQTLAERPGAAAVHLVSHGGDGRVQIGANGLDAQVLLTRAPDLAAWGSHLTQDADLLIYGCDVASGLEGQALVQGLAQLTGADVAASNDRTGSTALGGDWTLEVQTGAIEAQLAFDLQIQANWQGALATYVVTTTADGAPTDVGTLRWAITQANATPTVDDTITFNITGTGVHTITLASALPTITDTVVIDATSDDSFAANGNRPAIVLNGNSLAGAGLTLSASADGSTIRGLVIKNFDSSSILIESGSSGNTIAGNYLGALDTSGNNDAGAQGSSYALEVRGDNNQIGGATAADRNVLVNNGNGYGVSVFGAGAFSNRIQGNYFGTDATGNTAVGGTNTVWLFSSGANNLIGGGVGEGNVLADNIDISGAGSGSVIQGNQVGVSADGTHVLGAMTVAGISVSGSNGVQILDNWIAGVGNHGITLQTGVSSTVIEGNRIGTDLAGTANWGVSHSGIQLEGSNSNTRIANNTIANSNRAASSFDGISIVSGTGNAILGNSVYGTLAGSGGLGIDLGTSGATANDTGDADTGANNLQNFPVLNWAASNGSSSVTVSGSLNSAANSYFRIEFFASPAAHASAYGEGQIYLGFANVATDGSGNASFTSTLSANVPVAYVVSATATRSNASYATFTDTSEFALSKVLLADAQGLVVVTTTADTLDGDTTSLSTLLANQGADGFISLREAVTAANNTANVGGTPDTIQFGIAGLGVHTITLGSALPSITDGVVINATTDDSFAANGNRPAIVLDGNGLPFAGLSLSATADGSTIRGLVIKNFTSSAIHVDSGSSGNTIAGNYLGALNADGSHDAGADTSAYIIDLQGDNNVIGGSTAVDRNVMISNGANYGVFVFEAGAFSNRIQGNYIGTDATGNAGFGGDATGVSLSLSGANNLVGGSGAGEGNVMADGISVVNNVGAGSVIQGNRVGVSADGTSVLSGVTLAAIDVIGTNGVTIRDNWIANVAPHPIAAGNPGHGILLRTGVSNTIVEGNRIGTDLAGTANWGVSQSGIRGTASNLNNQIANNIIANSNQGGLGFDGIGIVSGTGNAILGNSIYGTNAAGGGLGIDHGNNGVTANDAGDADTGANNLQNFPVLTSAATNGSSEVNISGTFNSAASSYYRIEFFASPTANSSTYGEGKVYLGHVNVPTDGSGNATFSATLSAAVTAGHVISATATKTDVTYSSFTDTSEFAQSVTATAVTPGVLVVDTASDTSDGDTTSIANLLADRGADGFISLREAIIAANNTANVGGVPDVINFGIATTSTHTITLGSALPDITDGVVINATTDDSFAANGNRPAVVLDGNGLNASGLTLSNTADGSTVRGLLITNFQLDGIEIEAGSDGNTIAGNYIGQLTTSGAWGATNLGRGGIYIGGANNTIGGAAAADRNLIAGIAEEAIEVNGEASDGNLIQGNWIGLAADGSTVLGTTQYGIYIQNGADNTLIGGSTAGQGNVIVGTGALALSIDGATSGTLIRGNYLGTDSTLSVEGGNYDNINLAGGAHDNMIGGTGANDGNHLVNSDWNGVYLWGSAGASNAVLGNRIWNNGWIGIDLVGGTEDSNGVTANDAGDADVGPNNLQNYPVLTLASTNGSNQITVAGTLNSTANSYFRIEFFASPTVDASGYGQGQIYLGFVNAASNGAGDASFSTTLAAAVPVGYSISATATQSEATYSSFSNTSEFAQSAIAVSSTQATIVVDTAADTLDGDTTSLSTLLANKGADGEISLREAITAANNTANGAQADRINFAIAGTGVHTITLGSALPTITGAVVIDASTDDSFGANGSRPAVILNVNGIAGTHGLVLTNTADNSTIRGLVIRNHTLAGIRIDSGSDGNTIAGNYIGGLGADGNELAAVASTQGIDVRGANNLIGGNTPADRNVISAANNGSTNILITGVAATGNTVKGNFIGTDATGTVGFGYSVSGLTVSGGATGTTVGGSNAGDGNVVFSSGSTAVYFVLGGTGNLIQGNRINVSTAGNQLNTIFGPSSGIVLDGSVGTVVNNWIGRTIQDGIFLRTGSGSVVQGNIIGTDQAGTASWGTARHGIYVESGNNNLIGGTGAGQGNVVAYSNRNNGTFDGIYVAAGTGNAVMGNAVYGVANGGLGIDLGTSGVTANDAGDADAGANNLQNFPIVTLATTDGSSQLAVAGTLNSTASSYFRIEIFASAVANSSGYGEGAIFLGFVNVATDGSGNASFSTTLNVAVPVGYLISATATRSNATYSTFTDTSEFARNAVAISSTQGVLVVDTAADTADGDTTSLSTLQANRGADGLISLREAITAANNTANGAQADRINFGISGTGVHTITLGSILPSISDAVIIDASTDDSFAFNGSKPAIVLDGNNRNGHGLELLGSADGSTIRGLVITDFRMDGIHIGLGSDGNTIAGNYIGKLTSGGGVGSAGNDVDGISIYGSNNIIGGNSALDRNVISGNASDGVYIDGGSGNQILGNYIGTDATGNLANGNEEGGVYLTNGATGNSVVNNVIGANVIDEISIIGETSDGNIIQGNRVGLGADGSTVLGTPGSDGIYIFGGSDNNLIGGSNPGQGNVVVGTDWAIWIKGLSSGNVIRGNYVGTDSSLSVAGGTVNGIVLDDGAFSNTVGGTAAGDRNYVTNSGLYGIDLKINAGTGNALLGNQLWNNAGLGIDIGDIGVQANDAGDADAGANNLQNFPVLSQATTDGANISVAGTFNSLASSYFRIELFANAVADPLGHGEGQIYLGFVNVATDGAGNATFSTTLPVSVPVGYAISATATRSDATYSTFTDTSEFAAVLGVSAANVAPVITSNGGGATAAINVSEGTVSVTTVTATDANVPAQTLSYSISGGADQGQFSIDSASGVLSFVAAPDFEAPGDTGGNNVYDVIVQVSDGNGGTDTQAIAVTVTNANDAPTVANAIVNQSATEDAAFSFQFAANTFADVDVGDTLIYSAQLAGGGALPAWLSFDAVTRTFSGTPLNADVGTVSIDVIANDGNGGTVTDTFNITVANTNDAPTVASAIVNQNATEDTAFNFQFAANTFADADVGDTLTYSAQFAGGGALPAWLSFDAVTRTFSGTPLNADVGTVSIDVIANDGNGGTVTDTFNITVANTNDAPTVASAIVNQNATEDTAFNFQFAANTFADADVGDTLTYSAQLAGGGALPAWLSFDAVTRTFSGTPLNADVGTVSIDVIANDGNGGTVTDTFDITVDNTNDAPTVANAIVNQSATEDAAFSFQFAANTFADVDVGDTLIYSAQLAGGGALPVWLSFDAATRTFSGTPLNADIGTVSIDVIANDGNGGTVTDTFSITVGNTNDAPTVASAIVNQNATEDTAFNFQFAANTFADDDVGDTLTYSAQLAGGGALPAWLSFDAVTRTFSGTPLNADVGTVSIDVIANDGNGGTVTDTFDITVGNTNDAPTVANAIVDQSATEGTAFNFQFAANTFADADVGDTLTYSAQLAGGGALPAWLSFDAATRTFSGTPANGDVSTVSIDVIANDGNGGTVTDTFDITVANTNDAPTVANAIVDQSATEGTAFNFQFAANTFADLDVGDTLTYSAQLAGGGALPAWLSFDAATRTFSGTPANGDVGTVSIDVIANDGNGGTVTDTFNVTVANTNDAPTVANAIVNQNATEDTAFNFQFGANTFADLDVGDTLTYSAQLAGGGALPAWLSFDAATRTFSGTPANGDVGTVSIDVIANDGNGGTVTDTFDITVANSNDAPTVANPIPDQNATENTPFNFTFQINSFNDQDTGDLLTYAAQLSGGGALPAWLSFDAATRTFAGTPANGDVGTISIEVIASDSMGTSVMDTFNIVVGNTNDSPFVANAIPNQNATEDVAFNFTFDANAFDDPDVGDTLTFSASGLPAWLNFDPGTRTFSGTPANADVGTLSLTVTATDGGGHTVSDTFDLVVANSNDAPTVANALANQGATEDVAFNWTFAVNAFSDVDAFDTLTYTANGLPAWLSFDAATRSFFGTPSNADVGTVAVTVRATDGAGAFVEDSFNLSVANTNDAPTVANAIANQNATEDTAFNFQFAANTFADLDIGDTLSYSAQLAGGGALPTWLSFDAITRTFSGTPANGDVGTISIDVIADDGNGGTATDTFSITIANTNEAPTIANAVPNQNASEGAAFNFQLAANTFADADVGDTLTYSAQLAGGGALPAWLSFDAVTRTFSGTPTNGDVGTISIDVIADDGNGGTATDTFNITVGNTNSAPTVANAIVNQNATEDTSFNFQFAANTFADADVGDTLTYSAQLAGGGLLPAWLSFDAATRTFSGTPTNGDVGTVSVDIIANDGHGGTVTDNFNITVVNTNDAPTVANAINNQTASEGAAFNFQFAANTFADVDVGDTLSYSAQLAGGGALPAWLSFDAATRSFSGTPTNGDLGTFGIDVIAVDGNGGTVTDTFNISVTNTNNAPTVANAIGNQNATEDTPFNFTFAANSFDDADVGDTLGYAASGLPAWLSFDAATRSFSGTPANADVGTLAITVRATDGAGAFAEQSFSITVANTNDAPTLANPLPDQDAEEGTPFSFALPIGSFIDPDAGDLLTYSAQRAGGGALPAWLSFDAATQAFSGTPAHGDVGTISIEVTAADGNGGSVIHAFSLTVTPVNQAPSGAPAITGTPIAEQTLAVDTSGLADPDGLGPLSYQWLRDGAAIAGATGPTYQLGEPDVGRSISVRVSYTDGRGTGETLISSAIQAAAPAVEPPGTVPGTELPPVLPTQPVLPEAGTPGTPPEPETGSLPGGAGEESPATTAPRAPVEELAEATVLRPATGFPAVETQGLAEARNGTLSSKALDRVQATPAPEALLAYAASLDNWPHQMPGAVVYLPFDSEVRHGGAGGIESGTGADATTPPLAFTANAVALSGMVVSLGALAWGARSSMLLASLLMSTPSWRAFDLLPVLGAARDKRNEDDESVAVNLQAGRTRKDFLEEELT